MSDESIVNLRPVGDNLIVKPLNPEQVSKGGIIIPESAQNPPLMGVVLAAGTGRHSETGQLIPMEVQAGDKVVFNNFAGSKVRINQGEEPIIVMNVFDVLAVIEPGKKHCACPAHPEGR